MSIRKKGEITDGEQQNRHRVRKTGRNTDAYIKRTVSIRKKGEITDGEQQNRHRVRKTGRNTDAKQKTI